MAEIVQKVRHKDHEKNGDDVALRAVHKMQEIARRQGIRPISFGNHRKRAERTEIAPLGDEVYTPGINWDREDLGTGARPSHRDPHSLTDILKAFIKDSGWDENVSVGELKARWLKIVGENTARHVTIESFDNGKLVLSASSSSWQAQITALAAVLKEKINKELEGEIVQEIAVYTRWNKK
ncbi:MAG: DUF721 domain-containing protein [Actinomycetaceae bacterium]|nr:DUF721 domain-containing protein [Actinomycetaceae bacterium]